ncbi:hypothetical protein KKA15_02580 [Patescibacteria group bacterium]|nr:hypothetical protein [Patescibacteria group bacterium]
MPTYIAFEIIQEGGMAAEIIDKADSIMEAVQRTKVVRLYAVKLLGDCPGHDFMPAQSDCGITEFCQICAEIR